MGNDAAVAYEASKAETPITSPNSTHAQNDPRATISVGEFVGDQSTPLPRYRVRRLSNLIQVSPCLRTDEIAIPTSVNTASATKKASSPGSTAISSDNTR